MEYIGKYYERNVYYFDLVLEAVNTVDQFDNWICFAIASKPYPKEKAEAFIRNALLNGVLEFKAQGHYGEDLHILGDLTMVSLEVDEGYPVFDVMTTGDATTNLANAFWECFFATALPDRADYDHLKILCVSFDGTDYLTELKNYWIRSRRTGYPMIKCGII